VDNGLHLYDIILRPVITEKSTIMADELNHYVFEVDPRANKLQIKDAVESIFKVDVVVVRTMVIAPKRARRGRKFYMRTKAWKKAVVTVAPGQNISLFNV
jgi:large subunit ribosomal protein L23